MSLVNDMLRDLDRRKQYSGGDTRIDGLIGTSFDEVKTSRMLVPLLVVISLITGVGAGYFLFDRSLSEPVVPVPPMAMVSEPGATAPVQQLQAPPAPARLEITDVQQGGTQFSLRLTGNEVLDYTVLDRDDSSIALRFDGVKAYEGGSRIEGLSVIQMPDHTLVELRLDRDADIELATGATGDGKELTLAATYRKRSTAPQMDIAQQSSYATPGPATTSSASMAPAVAAEPPVTLPASTEPALVADATPQRSLDPKDLPLRVTRGLTPEQQDRNTSQSAVSLVQSGRLLEAYEKLLTFLAQNPEAHMSRETLGTVLFAQHEYTQASLVMDEGLALAPNYAPYKKIKARLLMQEGSNAQALQLLQSIPPSLQADKEYHELLATLYQQNGEHDRAIATYQELLRTNSSEGRWWTGMGISLEALGDVAKALASYQAALQQGGLDASVRQYSQNRVRNLSVQ